MEKFYRRRSQKLRHRGIMKNLKNATITSLAVISLIGCSSLRPKEKLIMAERGKEFSVETHRSAAKAMVVSQGTLTSRAD